MQTPLAAPDLPGAPEGTMLALLGLLAQSLLAPAATPPLDPSPAAPTAVGVLGVRDARGAVRTVRVDDLDGLTDQGNALYVPRTDGWWVVQTGTASASPGVYSSWTSARPYRALAPVTVPVAEIPCPDLPPDATNEGTAADTVLFVSPEWISVQHTGTLRCDGLRPWSWNDLSTGRLAQGDAVRPVAFDSALPTSHDAFVVAADRAWARHLGPDSCLGQTADEWALVRREGHWLLRGRLLPTAVGCDDEAVDFSVPTAGLRALTGPDALPVPFDTLAAAHPGLTDAVASPDGRLLVLIDPTGLTLVLDGATVDHMALTRGSLVMAQWATGTKAAEWASTGSPVGGVGVE